MYIDIKDVLHKRYCSEDLADLTDDINEALNSSILFDEDFEQGLLRGELLVSVRFKHEDSCDCQGFDHQSGCKHHVMCD